MNEAVFNSLQYFVSTYWSVPKSSLTKETALERDLKMAGDDGVEFVEEYSNHFGVDISNCDLRKYITPEGVGLNFPWIINWIRGRENIYSNDLTLGTLEKAILVGRLE